MLVMSFPLKLLTLKYINMPILISYLNLEWIDVFSFKHGNSLPDRSMVLQKKIKKHQIIDLK